MKNNILKNCWSDAGAASDALLKKLDEKGFSLKSEDKESIKKLTRENIDRPVIYIGAGTCGLGAGAAATKKQIEKYLNEKNINAEIIEVGCIGLCSAEPLVDIQIPKRTRISFKNVTADKVISLFDDFFNGVINEDKVLGQRSEERRVG